MSEGILKIIDYEEKIFSEYANIKKRMEVLNKLPEISPAGSSLRRAVFLVTSLKMEIDKTGRLPSFFNELDAEIKEILTQKNDVINTHTCVNCALKHVSSAAVIINEILNGYANTDHEIFLMGNLNEATEQIAETSTKLSNELRDLRVDIFETQKKVIRSHLRKIKEIYHEIKVLSGNKLSNEISTNPQVVTGTEIKPCLCKGK